MSQVLFIGGAADGQRMVVDPISNTVTFRMTGNDGRLEHVRYRRELLTADGQVCLVMVDEHLTLCEAMERLLRHYRPVTSLPVRPPVTWPLTAGS